MANETRASMVRSAASLIRSRGVSATSLSEVLADSGAPRGSIYHHFPEGKKQLAEDAIRWTSERVLAYLRTGPTDSASEVLERFIDLWRQVVVTSGGSAGCVVAGVAIDTSKCSPRSSRQPVFPLIEQYRSPRPRWPAWRAHSSCAGPRATADRLTPSPKS
jgi:AcrR family transcriptional regulator